MEVFLDAALDALIDTAKMMPFLFVIYVLIEMVEFKFSDKLGPAMERAGKAGPLVGAVAGIIPQCGISVMGTALYTQRLVTIGTLFAVYLATSDEAIPIILSQPEAFGAFVPLIVTKLVVAIVVGYALDVVFHKRNQAVFASDYALKDGVENTSAPAAAASASYACTCGCCAPDEACSTGQPRQLTLRQLLWYPLLHTLQISAFIFAVSLALALVFELVGQENLAAALEGRAVLQPVLAALIGIIPNCAASVAVTELYLDGVITFGAAIAGLCAGGGLGVLVLLEEDGNRKEALAIVGGLLVISIVVGLVVQALGICA